MPNFKKLHDDLGTQISMAKENNKNITATKPFTFKTDLRKIDKN